MNNGAWKNKSNPIVNEDKHKIQSKKEFLEYISEW